MLPRWRWRSPSRPQVVVGKSNRGLPTEVAAISLRQRRRKPQAEGISGDYHGVIVREPSKDLIEPEEAVPFKIERSLLSLHSS